MGDGEMDEPESMGAIGMASREKLDNLIFVVNCNLQRLDGPVRGNGKIIQELESDFRGAGWNVIKVIWGTHWDPLLARDKKGILMRRMMECVDGEYQTFKSKDGAYVREYFFNTPELKALVADWSDEEIWHLNRGGHDPHKIYAALRRGGQSQGPADGDPRQDDQGLRHGRVGRGAEHHAPAEEDVDRSDPHVPRPLPDPGARRQARRRAVRHVPRGLAGARVHARAADGARRLPAHAPRASRRRLPMPELAAFERFLKSTDEREISTTMAFVQILQLLVRDKNIGKHIVPIVPDESRTFGMEGMFRQLGIWNQQGQLYTPEDTDQLMFYKEDKDGQILQEGINEAGGMCDWIAAATSYSTHDVPMIPFYIFYSMFGFQRVGDLAWAAGDMRCARLPARRHRGPHDAERRRPAARGRPLARVLASTVPNCISYDPTFAYEVAVIIQDGLRRMYAEQEDVYYYLTVMNENYPHPAMPEGAAPAIIKGMYLFSAAAKKAKAPRVQLLGSGTILREVIAAAELLRDDWGVDADLWSCPRFTELARDGHAVARGNMLHPAAPPKMSHVATLPRRHRGPGDRGDRLHAHVRRADPRVRAAPLSSCSAPTASAAPTRARSCATSSRSTAGT